MATSKYICVVRQCACGQEFRVKAASDQLSCSPACAARARRRLRQWCALQGRCLRWITTERASVAELARRVGVVQSRIQYWFRNEDSTLPEAVLRAIAELVGITLEQAISEAGGKTAEQWKSEHGKRLAAWNANPSRRAHLQTAGRKGGAGNHGRHIPPEVVAARQATARSNGAADRAVAGLKTDARSTEGRLRRSLIAHLRWEPYTSSALHRWLRETSTSVGVCSAEVLDTWAPALHKRGLARPTGPRPDLERCRQLCEMLNSVRRSTSGRLPDQFWRRAADPLGLTYDVLRRWSTEHRKQCGVLDVALSRYIDKAGGDPVATAPEADTV